MFQEIYRNEHMEHNITSDETIPILRSRTQDTAENLRKLEEQLESYSTQYDKITKINAYLQQNQPNSQILLDTQILYLEKELLEQTLNQKAIGLKNLRITLCEKLTETCQVLTQLQNYILNEKLLTWKKEQQLAVNGATAINSNLDSIQIWCENLADLIWLNRKQIKKAVRLEQNILVLYPPGSTKVFPQLLAQITQLLSTLITSTFIIEKQPTQVIKINTKIKATVRSLIGDKLEIHMSRPQVEVAIISEYQAKLRLKNNSVSHSKSGEIHNNTGTMKYQQTTKQLSVSFKDMRLKNINRSEKKGTGTVMDEKFSLLFQALLKVGGDELTFYVWILSLPVVVIVHINQEPHAWATIAWDNAFSEPGRMSFAVPEEVSWRRIAEMLSLKFEAATGRKLEEGHLRFLADKAFRGNYQETNNPMLSWSKFAKEHLVKRTFTFWEWFYAVMKLTREHLGNAWIDGAINGFQSKSHTTCLLTSCSCGTFLLRFSDSTLGGITIDWMDRSGTVFSLKPFTAKELSIRSLADSIADLDYLVYLYPNVPKKEAFGKYMSNTVDQPPLPNGYIRYGFTTHVPGFTRHHGDSKIPQSFSFQPIDSSHATTSVQSSYAGSADTAASVVDNNTEDLYDYYDITEIFNQ